MGANEQGADATTGRWLTIPRTLCFVFNGDDILLMKRAPHRRVFPNRYNGLGGHIERDEEPYTGAIREIKEETGLDVHDVVLRGVHHIDAGADTGIMMFVFTAWSDSREITVTTDEGTLEWVPVMSASSLDLVEDLPLILPRLTEMMRMESAPVPYFAHVSYDADDQIVMKFVSSASSIG